MTRRSLSGERLLSVVRITEQASITGDRSVSDTGRSYPFEALDSTQYEGPTQLGYQLDNW